MVCFVLMFESGLHLSSFLSFLLSSFIPSLPPSLSPSFLSFFIHLFIPFLPPSFIHSFLPSVFPLMSPVRRAGKISVLSVCLLSNCNSVCIFIYKCALAPTYFVQCYPLLFVLHTSEIVKDILKNCQFMSCPKDYVIIKQGDMGDW